MSVETKDAPVNEKPITEPVDDAIVVHDDPVAAEEKAHDKLVADVSKMLGRDEMGEGETETAGEPEKPADEKPSKEKEPKAPEPKDDEPALDDETLSRAEGAGLSKELAQHLHQTGHLEETLAAFDRKMIERFQSREETDEPDEPGEKPARRDTLPLSRREPETNDQLGDVPELDPEIYDELVVQRDAYHKRRIDALEHQVTALLQHQQSAFDKRFDGMIEGLGQEGLFGKGNIVPKDKQDNRGKLFRAYQVVCQLHDVDPSECDPQWGKRAMAAMFPEEVFKQAQKQTVDRLRDAEGKFLSSSRSRGAPPDKGLTEEESHSQLVSNVTSYLKKEGVQMSGV